MANPEHLDLLKKGVPVWNEWRAKNERVTPDLSNTTLLIQGNLSGIDLTDATLNGSSLKDAELSVADFGGADLRGTDLQGANCVGTSFVGTDLTGANLRGTHLVLSLFGYAHIGSRSFVRRAVGTVFTKANFSGAHMTGCFFTGVDLSEAIGLEFIEHSSGSSLDIETLVASKGKLPDIFLKGCGVPEGFVTFHRSLLARPIEFYSCFISYSNKDKKFAERLYADLQNQGVRCWFAPEDIKIGDRFRQRVDDAIRLHERLLLVLSKHSVESDWVREEVESCLERERREGRVVLFPIRLDNAVMDTKQSWAASIRRQRHIGDFSKWKDHDGYQKAFKRLTRDLRTDRDTEKRGN